LKTLTKDFGGHVAVDKMNLSIRKHEVLAILGHNGAGKTTVINMITGMLMATKGDVELYGKSITKNTDKVR
jgi:ABC-type multidrug transport system ATPase subunit